MEFGIENAVMVLPGLDVAAEQATEVQEPQQDESFLQAYTPEMLVIAGCAAFVAVGRWAGRHRGSSAFARGFYDAATAPARMFTGKR